MTDISVLDGDPPSVKVTVDGETHTISCPGWTVTELKDTKTEIAEAHGII